MGELLDMLTKPASHIFVLRMFQKVCVVEMAIL